MSSKWSSAEMSSVFLEICERMSQLEKENKELKEQVSIRKQTRISELEDEIASLNHQLSSKERLITGLKLKVSKMDRKIVQYDKSWSSTYGGSSPPIFERRKMCMYHQHHKCRHSAEECTFAHSEEMLGTKYQIIDGICKNCK